MSTILVTTIALQLLPSAILAANRQSLTEALLGFLPIAVFLGILYLLFRRQIKSPVAKLQKEYLERQLEHTRRLEELLERIAKALERER